MPRLVVERDHGLRGLVAFDDLDRVVAGHVGERAGRRADRERPDLAGVVDGQRAVAGREPRREHVAMEAIEVERVVGAWVVQVRVDHAATVLTGGDRR